MAKNVKEKETNTVLGNQLGIDQDELKRARTEISTLTLELARSVSMCRQADQNTLDERDKYLALYSQHKMLCRILHDLAQHGYEVEKASPIPPTFNYNTSP